MAPGAVLGRDDLLAPRDLDIQVVARRVRSGGRFDVRDDGCGGVDDDARLARRRGQGVVGPGLRDGVIINIRFGSCEDDLK